MVVSGDITFRGNAAGYEQATDFFKETWLAHQGDKNRFLACPGNHDLCNTSFKDFDRFLYSIRRDEKINFSAKSDWLVKFEHIAFLMVNSVYHRDHQYGLIDCESLLETLEENREYLSSTQHRVAVIHHHLLGVQHKDTSTIRNAHNFISLLDKYNFSLLLHGHQHSQSSLKVGNTNMEIFSARSLNFPTSNLVNGINLFSYQQDRWYRDPMVLSEDNSSISGLAFSRME